MTKILSKPGFSKSMAPMSGNLVQHHSILRRDLSVLLLDSEVDILDEVAAVLRRRGVTVHLAEGTDEAERLLDTTPDIAVLLADITLLEEDGLALAARVLNSKVPAIELVMIAGARRSIDPRSPALMADLGLLPRPLRLREIAISVGKAIGRAAARRALPGALQLSAFDAA